MISSTTGSAAANPVLPYASYAGMLVTEFIAGQIKILLVRCFEEERSDIFYGALWGGRAPATAPYVAVARSPVQG